MVVTDPEVFRQFLRYISIVRPSQGGRPPRIAALVGAGLSAASGLPTFRGSTGALWHTHDFMTLATPEAFAADPGLVWRFYAYRRSAGLLAQPNAGHRALAALARACPGFLCISQNIDDLSQRAGHPPNQLRCIHGYLYDLKCETGRRCGYIEHDHRTDPLCPALAEACHDDGTATASEPPPRIDRKDLPACPKCREAGRDSLLRPGIVWFGESLDGRMLRELEEWMDVGPIDLMFVIGTTVELASASCYINDAVNQGARLVVINLDMKANEELLEGDDFAFEGSAAEILPRLLEPMIGRIE